MFNTERFILAVQNRRCLWDYREKCYGDKTAKLKAWEAIAKICFEDYADKTKKKREELVDELRKKWKCLRDYHVKEIREGTTKGGSAAPKKRKNSCVDMLRFLNEIILKEPQITSSDNCKLSTDVADSTLPETHQATTHQTPRSSQFDAASGPSHSNKRNREPADEESDTRFLLSLLPQMRSMDERQNFEFRLEVMKIIHVMKYQHMQPQTYDYTQNHYACEQPGYTQMPSGMPSPSAHSVQSSESMQSLGLARSIKEDIDEMLDDTKDQ